jgi:hydroxyethylthiazole kinase-like uncharacterized protein yjeF
MNPVRIRPDTGPWPLHDTQSSRAAEAAALAVTEPHALMRRAGFTVARLALALHPHAGPLRVLAGPGNNGGDGLVAALHLHRAGRAVRVYLLGDAQMLPTDAADALANAQAAGVSIATRLDEQPCGLVIDALLGLGTSRAAEGVIAEAIRSANAGSAPVLAIDIPSCLNADTGQPLGGLAMAARHTLALLTLKPGLFSAQGRDHAGDVWFDNLGENAQGASAALAGPPARNPRAHASHKGSFGDVAIVGGAAGMTGAAWLAASAALTAGAGRVYVSMLDATAPLLNTRHPELMTRPEGWRSAPAVLGTTTVVCGCGGGARVRETLPALLAHAGQLVLDADALNAIAGDTALQSLLRSRSSRGQPTVLTPHPLEAARLLAISAAEVQADRLAAASALIARYGAVVALKGSGTIVAAPDTLPSINPTGNGRLATPGTGDVLAGWIGGLWAQGQQARTAAIAAVWQHGWAAQRATGDGPLRATDLVEAMAMAGA